MWLWKQKLEWFIYKSRNASSPDRILCNLLQDIHLPQNATSTWLDECLNNIQMYEIHMNVDDVGCGHCTLYNPYNPHNCPWWPCLANLLCKNSQKRMHQSERLVSWPRKQKRVAGETLTLLIQSLFWGVRFAGLFLLCNGNAGSVTLMLFSIRIILSLLYMGCMLMC